VLACRHSKCIILSIASTPKDRAMVRVSVALAVLLTFAGMVAASAPSSAATPSDPFVATDRIFAEFCLDAHVPGLVYGVVIDGRLVHAGAFGVQDLDSKRPVNADTLFRIASMTKAFTALTLLKLRDDGLVQLDANADQYVPELRDWKYPTEDSPRIRVRDLLSHSGGLVTDDPWGDRQTPLPEADFSRLLREGVPFTRAPGTVYEYSNLGYALVGRIITNVSKHPYAETITQTLLVPLGMTSSGFVADAAPKERRALGYRWEDDAWRPEPLLGPGAFGAMGGLQTSANDYAKWLTFLLSAWPARDGTDAGPVRRSTVRELAEGVNMPRLRDRFARTGSPTCKQAATYGRGMIVAMDCDLGVTLSHGGGYPGYGSHVLLMPDRGAAIFALANRTYAGPSAPVWDSAISLLKAGALPDERAVAPSAELVDAYRTAVRIYKSGSVSQSVDALAMNFLLDRDADGWSRDLARLKSQVGDCDSSAPLTATGALAGEFTWRCARGRLKGSVLLTPTRPPRIQQFKLAPIAP
jgi:serine-type D-Ala-D-Ala carboxypeptidase/endopeptidase